MSDWRAEYLYASLKGEYSRAEELWVEHVRSPDDVFEVLELAREFFGMSEEEMTEAVENWLERYKKRIN